MEPNSLDVVAVHEHDVVPVGAVHVQVDLADVGGQSSGSGLQFLQMSRETAEENVRSFKSSATKAGRSNLVIVLLLLLDFGNVEQQTPDLPPQLQGNSLIDPPNQL